MEKRKLGTTDIQVSSICLGTMTWGQQNTQDEGFEQMDYALDMGINFFDTAEMYAVPPKKETQGSTEKIIGNWFNERKNRDQVILATKVCGRAPFTWLRDDEIPTEQTKKQIFEAVDKSLEEFRSISVVIFIRFSKSALISKACLMASLRSSCISFSTSFVNINQFNFNFFDSFSTSGDSFFNSNDFWIFFFYK